MAQTLKTKSLFLVPYWIVNSLARHGLPLTTVRDLPKLREIVSAEDLTLTLILNQHPAPVFGVDAPTSGLNSWLTSPEACAIYGKLTDLVPLHQQGLEERLLNEHNADPKYPHEFEIRDLDDDTFLVIIYPGHFGGADAQRHQFKLIRAYLKQWYGYSNFDAVARDPLFQRYLTQL